MPLDTKSETEAWNLANPENSLNSLESYRTPKSALEVRVMRFWQLKSNTILYNI